MTLYCDSIECVKKFYVDITHYIKIDLLINYPVYHFILTYNMILKA